MTHEKQRLYIDVSQWGAPKRYVTWQLDLLPMLWGSYDLSKFEERILLYICMQYDNAYESNRDPLKLSYKDIADIVKCSYDGAKKAMGNLLYWELIITIGERKGSAKTQYIPNVSKIHQLLKKYLNVS